jgi:hypothetical protein
MFQKLDLDVIFLTVENILEFSFQVLNFHQNFLNLDNVITSFIINVILPLSYKYDY